MLAEANARTLFVCKCQRRVYWLCGPCILLQTLHYVLVLGQMFNFIFHMSKRRNGMFYCLLNSLVFSEKFPAWQGSTGSCSSTLKSSRYWRTENVTGEWIAWTPPFPPFLCAVCQSKLFFKKLLKHAVGKGENGNASQKDFFLSPEREDSEWRDWETFFFLFFLLIAFETGFGFWGEPFLLKTVWCYG